ncbi:MAG TPA: G1 family glutamic endopeptidase [Thermomicrobiaceae bacterium]|nr:G1 family glutamic endopeptidase [Thermomicrobiaceae bacterium]
MLHRPLDRFADGRARIRLARLLVTIALVLPLAACTVTRTTGQSSPGTNASVPSTATPASAGATATATPAAATPTATSEPTPTATASATYTTTPAASVGGATPIASGTPSASDLSAIKSVILRGNHEQEQALTARNPSLMRDTSTSAYYQQQVQTLSDLVSSGVTAIKLVKLVWGPIRLTGANSAQATTLETWDSTLIDGSTLQETDTNVYTLARQHGTWEVSQDQHPGSHLLQPPGSSASGTPTPVAPLAPVGPGQSQNWAGYAATGGTFTAVAASWTIPRVSATTSTSADATWVGIGGAVSTDLIQAGTDASVQGGRVRYAAWLETLPQAQQIVPLSVTAGDRVSVSITQQPAGAWKIAIRDATSGQSYQTGVSYASSRTSAEWVEESPAVGRSLLLPLDNFGSVTFTGASTVKDGKTDSISAAGGQPITMYAPNGQPLAQPSKLVKNGSSFTVTRTGAAAPQISPGSGNVPLPRRPDAAAAAAPFDIGGYRLAFAASSACAWS